MTLLRLTLGLMLATILTFTITAVYHDGVNLLPHFIAPIRAMTWQGQFHVDFATYLVLSGVWMAWRGGWTRGSVALGVLTPALGIMFFAPYLLYLINKTDGEPRALLLGVHAR